MVVNPHAPACVLYIFAALYVVVGLYVFVKARSRAQEWGRRGVAEIRLEAASLSPCTCSVLQSTDRSRTSSATLAAH
ncbi:hypothetical protein DL89DRAFT_28164 [Linderina pennispora]|uniref:Copper transporter n=1 Tax=Linderina pennispora TaxID=61395 RepID=A0A1Y1W3U1_9FUNG|nr:uncharacterized protein DL89DRAFT_28164 [Linderina pennispora]ORX68230.1 hypothetical protein DL89DRAFT_28164 [Linderina pennispora]